MDAKTGELGKTGGAKSKAVKRAAPFDVEKAIAASLATHRKTLDKLAKI